MPLVEWLHNIIGMVMNEVLRSSSASFDSLDFRRLVLRSEMWCKVQRDRSPNAALSFLSFLLSRLNIIGEGLPHRMDGDAGSFFYV